ncbi:MerR family transcriptional regulator [Maritalea mediterranea]|uniref:MerR family transcriptional regulator n=1 Tax=Maritalea mediterranea TaxID=2909667 RepID=A0ABS9E8F9_9HYPH|nr:MerR family transcriptional regulator [Maritalea mediterranea]MCF4098189.1 MerR family transcriptional regulator [Maritalea mediterranea]
MQKSPDAFRTISEAADELDLPQHVLRFWETRFKQIKPLKRGGGRRYYRPDDVQLLRGIRYLLYDEGFTIKGVQKILKEHGARHVIAIGETGAIEPVAPVGALSNGNGHEDTPEGGENRAEASDGTPNVPSEITVNEAIEIAKKAGVTDTYSRARLNEALTELLECKRILEEAVNSKSD